MKLQRFRATNFRSVEGSGWIDLGDIIALIGTSESSIMNLQYLRMLEALADAPGPSTGGARRE